MFPFLGCILYHCTLCHGIIPPSHVDSNGLFFHPCSRCFPHSSNSQLYVILNMQQNSQFMHHLNIFPPVQLSFTCSVCGLRHLTRPALFWHIVNFHMECRTPVYCPICLTIPNIEHVRVNDIYNHIIQEHSDLALIPHHLYSNRVILLAGTNMGWHYNSNSSSVQFINQQTAGAVFPSYIQSREVDQSTFEAHHNRTRYSPFNEANVNSAETSAYNFATRVNSPEFTFELRRNEPNWDNNSYEEQSDNVSFQSDNIRIELSRSSSQTISSNSDTLTCSTILEDLQNSNANTINNINVSNQITHLSNREYSQDIATTSASLGVVEYICSPASDPDVIDVGPSTSFAANKRNVPCAASKADDDSVHCRIRNCIDNGISYNSAQCSEFEANCRMLSRYIRSEPNETNHNPIIPNYTQSLIEHNQHAFAQNNREEFVHHGIRLPFTGSYHMQSSVNQQLGPVFNRNTSTQDVLWENLNQDANVSPEQYIINERFSISIQDPTLCIRNDGIVNSELQGGLPSIQSSPQHVNEVEFRHDESDNYYHHDRNNTTDSNFNHF